MLYQRKCDAPGHRETIISMYAPEESIKVYDHEFWFGDKWDAAAQGREYDFSKPFFGQFKELLQEVPHIAFFDSKSVDSRYCNITVEHKNCYMVSAGWNNEDSMYSNRISYCKDTLDSYVCHKTEFGYENVSCRNSYQLFFSIDSENCDNSSFLYDCKNCSYCIGCTNLRYKQYHIFNKPYTKEEYFKRIKDLDLGKYTTISFLKGKFQALREGALHKYANLLKTENVIGDHVENSRNCYCCFDLVGDAENVRYSHWGTYGLRDSYDTGPGTGGNSELLYEGVSIGVKNARCMFGVVIWYSHDVLYSFNCHDSHHLFGSVGLRSKSYCILNKQYLKEEYECLLPKIKEHMQNMPYKDSKGREYRYGEFFPPEMSPYTYNETVALDYLPLSKEDAASKGFRWREEKERKLSITIEASDISDNISNVSDSITKDTIGCEHKGKCQEQCTAAFRITPQELAFYRKFNLPLPRYCLNCRHYQRIQQRNPLKLWRRKCRCNSADSEYRNTATHIHGEKACPNEFETSYAPERKEIVYCEACYLQEIA